MNYIKYAIKSVIAMVKRAVGSSSNQKPIMDEGGLEAMDLEAMDLEGTNWTLRAFDLDDERLEVLDGTEITLQFAESRVSGLAGCNRFFSSYTLTGDALTVGGIGTTRMACQAGVMQQERRFVQALSAAKSVSLEENSLRVECEENVGLVFARKLND